MEKIRNAAIILLGIGEMAAGEILKNMKPREVKAIIDVINTIDKISEEDLIVALNDFFTESNNSSGIDLSAKEQIKNSLLTAMGNKGIGSLISSSKDHWFDLLKHQSATNIIELIQDEHPQIITAIVIVIFNNIGSDNGTKLIKAMPKEMQAQVFRRIANIGYISKAGVEALSTYFQKELEQAERNNVLAIDGVETAANIISYLDSTTEQEVLSELEKDSKELGEKIQDKIFPFSKLAELDARSLQTLLAEVKSDDLVLALKGVDDHLKEIFMKNMSSKAAEILRDDLEAKGPVKIANVIDAQKTIINLAKQLAKDEKIILSSRNNSDTIF